MKAIKTLSILGTALLMTGTQAFAEEKHHEDPTRIVTKAGVGINDENVSISGSLGLDDARMMSARINDDGEWRLGGSWLFDVGIVNFNFSRTDYDHGSYSKKYSVGTFVPLSYFGIKPAGWMIFPMAGYNYSNGKIAIPNDNDVGSDYVLMRNKSHGAYLGVFGVKPLNDTWSVMAFGGAGAGSNSYSSHWGGAGMSYKLNDTNSVNFYGFMSEDDFGSTNKLGASYTHQF